MSDAQLTDPEQRVIAIDVVRGAALFGVMTVNLVDEFRVSIFAQFLPEAGAVSRSDELTLAFMRVALQSKAFALFSLLLGVSTAILYQRLQASGRPRYWLARRFAALLAFGVVHLLFLWHGDILTEYAIAGFLLLPLLGASMRVLALAAAALLAIHLVVPFPPIPSMWPDVAALREHASDANRVYASGSYAEICRFSLGELPLILNLHLFVFARTLALFLLGVLAWRGGLLAGGARARTLLRAIAIVGCVAGGGLSVAGYAGVQFGPPLLDDALWRLDPVMLALGYGAAIVAFVQAHRCGPVCTALARVGRMAFSNYIAQSVVFALIFFGYGLGLFGRLAALPTLVLGVVFFVAQMCGSVWWLGRFRYGPLEWLWRALMYGRAPPMRAVG